MEKVDTAERFCEDVCSIICGVDSKDADVATFDMLTELVELHTNVFDVGVPDLILGEAKSGVVVAMYGSGGACVKLEA